MEIEAIILDDLKKNALQKIKNVNVIVIDFLFVFYLNFLYKSSMIK